MSFIDDLLNKFRKPDTSFAREIINEILKKSPSTEKRPEGVITALDIRSVLLARTRTSGNLNDVLADKFREQLKVLIEEKKVEPLSQEEYKITPKFFEVEGSENP